jgi:hypothetical protein
MNYRQRMHKQSINILYIQPTASQASCKINEMIIFLSSPHEQELDGVYFTVFWLSFYSFTVIYLFYEFFNVIFHRFPSFFVCGMLEVEWSIGLKKLDVLRCKLINVSPVISKGIENMKFMHSIYLDLYLNGETLFRPAKIKSELMFHITHHFAMILVLIDEVNFLKDGRILRPHQQDIAFCGEFVHPTQTDSFFPEEVDLKILNVPLCMRSISGYLFEESNLLKLVSTIFKIH